jgi:DNA-binding LacI/PurR family transcriptional regulator
MTKTRKTSFFITVKDVAEHAGVSIATVSRVVNHSEDVSPELREKVLHTIEELGYHPSRTAQRLRARKSLVIGLIISDIQNPFFTSVVRGIEDVAHQQDYSIILCNSDEDPEKEKLYIDVMRSEEVAGVIISSTSQVTGYLDRLLDSGIPVVAMDRSIKHQRVDIVSVENVLGAYEAVSHLLQKGHQWIGFIGLPMNLTTGVERREGYINALNDHGLKPAEELMCIGDARQEGGFNCAKDLLDRGHPLTALFVSNNLMTLGALGAIKSQGLLIPEDISLIGFDDMPWAQYLSPPLTAVSQPTYELGKHSAELLLKRISNPSEKTQHIRLKTELIVRESVGPPPGSNN